jgi:hypothetical protein
MKPVKILIALFSIVAVVGCGGTKQDPLADQSDAVKNNQPPKGPEAPKEKPLASDVLKIDGSDYFVFREGVEQEITIKARSAFDEAKYTLEVTNADQFKDMTIVGTEGDVPNAQQAEIRIKWLPPKGLVYADVVTLNLQTMVYTTNLEENYSFKKNFSIFIYKESYNIPEILTMDPIAGAVKEGSKSTFKVKVKDLDSSAQMKPDLVALRDFTNINGAPFLTWNTPKQDPTDPNIWLFDVTVDLGAADVTSGSSKAEFGLAAVSNAGKKSAPRKGNFTIWTSVLTPVTSWSEKVEFKIGATNVHNFTVIDPRGEGELTTLFTTQCAFLSGAPTCTCKLQKGVAGKANSAANCSIAWTVPVDAFENQDVEINYKVENKSPVFGDKDLKSASFVGQLKLVK